MIEPKTSWRDRFDQDDVAAMALIVLVFVPPLLIDLLARYFAP